MLANTQSIRCAFCLTCQKICRRDSTLRIVRCCLKFIDHAYCSITAWLINNKLPGLAGRFFINFLRTVHFGRIRRVFGNQALGVILSFAGCLIRLAAGVIRLRARRLFQPLQQRVIARLLLQRAQRFRALQYEQRVFTQKIIRYIQDAGGGEPVVAFQKE